MTKRKPLSKKLRFEIFKRDGFTCAYCGNKPPSVVLEIDHIEPVCRGGDNSEINLVTSCMDCNRGKAGTPLNSIPSGLADNISIIKEREEQLREYRKILRSVKTRETREINRIDKIYNAAFPEWRLSKSFKNLTVKKFLKLLQAHEVEEAMEIATNRKSGNSSQCIKYFCGICWRKIKGTAQYEH